MRVRLLGPVDLVDAEGRVVPIGSPTQRLVLAVLGAHFGEVVPFGRLVDAIWAEAPPPSAESSLRSYISRLRRLLGDAVASHPGGWSLRVPPEQLDTARFEQLLAVARLADDPVHRLATIAQALAVWRGPAFGEFTDDSTLRPVAVRLTEARYAARESRAALLLATGRAPEAVGAAEELLAERPWRESTWVTLVDALRATGRVAEALAAYRRAHDALSEVGLDPGIALREAQRAALAGTPAPGPKGGEAGGGAQEAAPDSGGAQAAAPRGPRRAVTTLVGREKDLVAVGDLMATARIVTLVGPGGVGKTRLALDLAARLAGRFAQGVRVVELARLSDAAGVGAFVADALGVTVPDGDVLAALELAAALDLLVVLDNCEHLVGPLAEVAATLVEHGTGLRVLATSRERLDVDGEHCWPVEPLGVDGPDAPAAELFRDRARAARPALEFGPAEMTAIDRIVRRVDGLPLAIEMAAARTAGMSPVELAERLDDHLDLLRDPRRSGAARHRTLAAVVAWSTSLLDDPHRRMLAVLSVFAGPVRAVDVAALAGCSEAETLDRLEALAARSLVVVDTSRHPAHYGLLEIVREYARGRLLPADHRDDHAARHARHVLEVLRSADAGLRTSQEADAHARLLGLLAEARAAGLWAMRTDPALAVDLAAAVHIFTYSRLRTEPFLGAVELLASLGLDRSTTHPRPLVAVEADLDSRGIDRGSLATLLATAAVWYANIGELAEAEELARLGVRWAGDRAERRFPLEVLADVQMYGGRCAQAVETGRRTVAAAREAGDLHGVVAGVVAVTISSVYDGRPEVGREALRQAPDARNLAPSDAGWLAYGEAELIGDRDPDRCLALFGRATTLADEVGNRFLGGVARASAVSVRARHGDPRAAVDAFVTVIEHWREQGDRTHQLTTLRNLVKLFERLHVPVAAAQLLGAVTSDTVKPSYGQEAEILAEAWGWARRTMGPVAAEAQRAIGAAWDVDAAARMALDHLTALVEPKR